MKMGNTRRPNTESCRAPVRGKSNQKCCLPHQRLPDIYQQGEGCVALCGWKFRMSVVYGLRCDGVSYQTPLKNQKEHVYCIFRSIHYDSVTARKVFFAVENYSIFFLIIYSSYFLFIP